MTTTNAASESLFEQNLPNNVVDDLGVNPRSPRWLIYAGDQLPPDFKRQVSFVRMGGINLGTDFKSLALTRGFLRRCTLTPLVIGYDMVNEDLLGDNPQELPGVARFSRRVKSHEPADPERHVHQTWYGYERLPAHDLQSILQLSAGESDWGIREVVCLRGVDPMTDEGMARVNQLQRQIFPDWDDYESGESEFFGTVDELEEYLQKRALTASGDAAEVIGLLRDSNQAFRRWAERELDKMNRLVKAPITTHGRAFAFEPLHQDWFRQLNLTREDFAKRADPAPPLVTSIPSREEFDAMKDMLGNIVNTIGAVAGVRPVRAAASIENVEPETVDIPGDAVCAGLNKSGDPCGGKVVKMVDGAFFCASHPKK